jgi:transcription-repair coupling factor (superfamily II helicase)
METVWKPLGELNAYNGTRECLERGRLPVHVSGCIDGQKSHFISGLSRGQKWTLVVAANEQKARQLLADYRMYDRDTLYYPAKDVIFYSADVHGSALEVERLKTVQALLCRDGGTVITTMSAGMEYVQSLSVYEQSRKFLAEGDSIDLSAFEEQLTDMGYTRQSQVDRPGDYSVRGGILDIFPPTEECPYRIELWGDELDTIRSFDVESQRSIERVPSLEIFPAVEIILNGKQLRQGFEKMKKEQDSLRETHKKNKNFEAANRLSEVMKQLQDRLEYTRSQVGLESYLPYFDSNTGSFFDFFDVDRTLLVVDEPVRCLETMRAVEEEFRQSMEGRLEKGLLLPGQMDVLYSAETVCAMIQQKKTVYLSMLDHLSKEFTVREHYHLECQSVGSYNKHFELLAEDTKKWKERGYRVLLLCGSRTRAQRLAKDLQEYDVNAFYRETMDVILEPGQIMVSYGRLSKGFSYTQLRFVVVTEGDIFGERKKSRRKSRKQYNGQSIQGFNELNVGDYVIHEDHGLGIYRGIEKITVDNVAKDFVKIEYGDGGNLYVPASSLDVLQKYADGDADRTPKLNRLNSVEWKKTKTRVRGAVKEIARELVQLYARRQEQKGYCFSEDTIWQKEFEELFPFEETTDQLDAIAATKRDMESSKIMDRLICGDVGYGKTEIAIRAAFKAVNDSKQVAFLVPTTILAQQHYNTFQERLGDFPVKVEMLSRFRTAAQQKKTLEKLRKGEIDIVIGTHRLLSKDVKFKDLGLLVVDEEQRFGVTHKEKIKQMKGNVDVLTLSATPIPRTLHMSLVGIRDMSVLEEPPVDRLPIQTFVMEHSGEIIREAINRELARGGQVYYVYNRVRNIEEIAMEVSRMVPDASVAYAHGQMSERELERIMMSFIQGEIDVLIATTIIETGLDISNVNTIIIDNADQMGLSQLYQLRGRVGRSNRTAYAFLMYKRDKMLKEVAEKRLAAIKEYTDLGSGIKVAMRDLEIRGAGNLLGAAQSGHMEAVGYDLYCKMLNEAVLAMKGEKPEREEEDTSVDLQVDAFIPATYIKSEFQKLDMYKRIAGIETEEERSDMEEELVDRFGDIPRAAQNLLQIALLKSGAHRAGIVRVLQKEDGICFYLQPNLEFSVEKVPAMMESYGGSLRYVNQEEPYFFYTISKKQNQPEQIFQAAGQVVKSIGALREQS